MNKPFTNAEIAAAVRLRMAGWRTAQIADMIGRSKQTIDWLLSAEKKKHGHHYPKIPRPDRKWTESRIEQEAWQSANSTLSCLGSRHGVTPQRMGFLMRKRAIRLQEGTWTG